MNNYDKREIIADLILEGEDTKKYNFTEDRIRIDKMTIYQSCALFSIIDMKKKLINLNYFDDTYRFRLKLFSDMDFKKDIEDLLKEIICEFIEYERVLDQNIRLEYAVSEGGEVESKYGVIKLHEDNSLIVYYTKSRLDYYIIGGY